MAFSNIDVQKTFDDFVEDYGGVVSDRDKRQKPRNADYIFHTARVVAELKILSNNPHTNKEFISSLREKQRRWIERGDITRERLKIIKVIGELPPQCRTEINRLYTQPIQKHVKEANRQIKSTKSKDKLDGYKGLLILVSDGNFLLNPKDVFVRLERLFANGLYSTINTVTYLTVNVLTTRPDAPAPARLWINLFRDTSRMENEVPVSFLDDLHDKWADFFTKRTGIVLNRISEVDESGLSENDYLRDTEFIIPT